MVKVARVLDCRRLFLLASIGLTLLGCFVSAFAVGLVQWQYVEMREFNSVHEHGIFADCVRSEVTPLATLRRAYEYEDVSHVGGLRRKCVYKMDPSAAQTIFRSLESGDVAAREYLLHRFLPQHKAVIFFTVFTFIFAGLSIVIGSCSSCFIPNGLLHVISLVITTVCSLLGDVMFFLASMRIDNRFVHGVVDVYQQKIGYAFYVHLSAVGVLLLAVLAACASAYLLFCADCHSTTAGGGVGGGGESRSCCPEGKNKKGGEDVVSLANPGLDDSPPFARFDREPLGARYPSLRPHRPTSLIRTDVPHFDRCTVSHTLPSALNRNSNHHRPPPPVITTSTFA